MSGGNQFVLDANVFIQAHRTYYAFGICPGFWKALERQHEAKHLCSIDKVKDELSAMSDELSDWADKMAEELFFKGTSDKKVIDAYREMMIWVQSTQQYTQEAKAQFSSVADGWIVAFAKVNGLTVVTHEEYAPEAKNTVPIPNVCIEFSVPYCNTFKMLHALKEQFVLRHGGAKK
jgi:Domain of unknown function (DUF4411)